MAFFPQLLRHPTGAWALALLGVVLTACSAPALPPGYRKAEQLERQGRYEAARAQYAEAARTCDKKPDACATTEIRVAQMLVKLKRPREAVKVYLHVSRGYGRGLSQGARSLARAAKLLSDLGEHERALSLWWEVIDRYPETLAADDALGRIVQRYRDQKRRWDLLPLLRQRYLRLHRQDIGDNLLWEAAQILETSKDVARQNEAAAFYVKISKGWPQGGLKDDAFMAAAAIRRRQKRFQDAIALYQALLRTREDSTGGASYHSEFLDDAQLDIAKIWLLDLHRPARAIPVLEDLIRGKPASVLRDDAQLYIVLAEVERGRVAAARRAFRKLVQDYPDSRFVKLGPGLELWYKLRAAARRGDLGAACAAWATLKKTRPFGWLVRKGPRPKPWPSCQGGAR